MTVVLVAEDDPAIAEPLARALRKESYQVVLAESGGAALAAATEQPVSVMILDLGLPGVDGLEVCRRIRASGRRIAVLMLTARADEMDVVVGLDAGADDYVAKPFRMSEVLARVRALLRRNGVVLLSSNGVLLDASARKVTVAGTEVALTPKEFDLLHLLMTTPDQVVSREEIVDALWGDPSVLNSKTLDMHVSGLRHKLAAGQEEPLDRHVATVRGAGLRFNG
ncbi:response regulator [Nakamurella sp. YIM 132087]|uniref:Response regulator n=1 Tax=Nakamurella alba TaxID=2665158 RepID=A0A7K1FLN8_9ACTN|nr:response regulator transcription factor [Nakamurella alba]MTD14143.1 response regulator [Nakamurella alba]